MLTKLENAFVFYSTALVISVSNVNESFCEFKPSWYGHDQKQLNWSAFWSAMNIPADENQKEFKLQKYVFIQFI